jgi:hypothetical protein
MVAHGTLSAGAPGRAHKLAALALVGALCLLQLRAMWGPYEDWPFTSAPMFARYHAAGDPLFEFRLFVVGQDGAARELDPRRDLGLSEIGFRRQFFANYYGSTDPYHPSRHLPGDDEQAFLERVRDWMLRVERAYRVQNHRTPRLLRLEVWRIRQDSIEKRPIVEYRTENHALRRLYEPARSGSARVP